MELGLANLSRNFRFGPLTRASYASAAIDTTNLPFEQGLTGIARLWRPGPEKRSSQKLEACLHGAISSFREEDFRGLGRHSSKQGMYRFQKSACQLNRRFIMGS